MKRTNFGTLFDPSLWHLRDLKIMDLGHFGKQYLPPAFARAYLLKSQSTARVGDTFEEGDKVT